MKIVKDLKFLNEISRSKEIFDFSIQQKGVNFNDLYERLENDTLLAETTISDMNEVSRFFNALNDLIKKQNNISLEDLSVLVC